MADRYFSETPITGDQALLTGPEAHHLIHVMRARPGASVTLFDGSGGQFASSVTRVGRSEVELAVLAREEANCELPFLLTLGVALPKGDRQKWLVEKATELGVGRLVPLATARAVAQPVAQALVRLRRGVIEASKQCGRNRLMEIGEPLEWEQFVSSGDATSKRWLAHPRHEAPHDDPGGPSFAAWHASPVIVAVGPEGGFTDEEVALALAAGWQSVDLGPRILRVETAALVLAAMALPQ